MQEDLTRDEDMLSHHTLPLITYDLTNTYSITFPPTQIIIFLLLYCLALLICLCSNPQSPPPYEMALTLSPCATKATRLARLACLPPFSSSPNATRDGSGSSQRRITCIHNEDTGIDETKCKYARNSFFLGLSTSGAWYQASWWSPLG